MTEPIAPAGAAGAASRETQVTPAADKARLAVRTRRWGTLYQAERTLRSMRAYGGVIITSSVGMPLMYILAMGLGLGVLVGDADVGGYGAPSYLAYIGPAILASTVAMSAGIEFTFPVLEGFKWRRLYYGGQASPLTPRQIASGHIVAVCCRFLFHAAVFTAVLALFGAVTSPWAWAQVVTACLGGLALGLPIMAYISTLREEQGHASLIQRFAIMPLFLFSATFYPLTNLPGPLQLIGWLSPMWHANELGRVLSFGQPTPPWLIAIHLGYLVALVAAGYLLVVRVFTRRLGFSEWKGRSPGERTRQKVEAKREARETARFGGEPATRPELVVRRGIGSSLYSGNIRAVVQRGLAAVRNNRGVIFFSGLLEPLLYLTSFGLGISPMISGVEAADGGQLSYAAFIAPALLAVAAMNGAVFDSTWNVFFKLKITKLYHTMMATSLGPLDVAIGEILLALLRGGIYGLGFCGVLVGAGLVDPMSALLMLLAALFIALAFAAAGMAVTSFMSRFQQMDWMMMVIIPMFLFSATLFPIDVYPEAVQRIIQALPLWHGVELMRDIAFWDFSVLTLIHIGYYLALIAAGLTVTTLRLRRLFLR